MLGWSTKLLTPSNNATYVNGDNGDGDGDGGDSGGGADGDGDGDDVTW